MPAIGTIERKSIVVIDKSFQFITWEIGNNNLVGFHNIKIAKCTSNKRIAWFVSAILVLFRFAAMIRRIFMVATGYAFFRKLHGEQGLNGQKPNEQKIYEDNRFHAG